MRFEFTFGQGPRPTPPDPETPFRVLVLGDFSGRGGRRPPVPERRPARVDIDSLESFLERQNAEVDLEASGGAALRVAPREFDDLHPDRLYQQLDVFAALRGARARLLDASTFASAAAEVRSWSGQAAAAPAAGASAGDDGTLERLLGRAGSSSSSVEPAPMSATSEMIKHFVAPHIVPAASADRPALVATVDAAITAAMRQVLRDPAFQALESAWRGLDFLVRQIESEEIQLFAMNLSKAELLSDLASAQDARESPVFRALVDRAPGSDPWALVLGLYAFDDGDPDAEALGKMALVAQAANAPFVAAAAAPLVQAALEGAPSSKGWGALRARPEAAFLGLVCPRFLLRLPYGRATDPISAFAFEEFAGRPEPDDYLWGPSAVVLGVLFNQAFAASGWGMSPGPSMDLGGLPVYVRKDGHETEMTPCAEIWLNDPQADKLLQQGLMPLQSFRGRDAVRLTRVQSIATPAAPLGGPWG
jgi:predicted component of type VI protein secretion system